MLQVREELETREEAVNELEKDLGSLQTEVDALENEVCSCSAALNGSNSTARFIRTSEIKRYLVREIGATCVYE